MNHPRHHNSHSLIYRCYLRAMRATHDAIENVQEQALVRELQIIKGLVADGALTPAHAKELRNTVYIQQLVLD